MKGNLFDFALEQLDGEGSARCRVINPSYTRGSSISRRLLGLSKRGA